MSNRISLWNRPLPNPTESAKEYAREQAQRREAALRRDPEPIVEDAETEESEEAEENPTREKPLPEHVPPPKMRGRGKTYSASQLRNHRLSIVLSREEAKLFKKHARELHTSFSALVRTAMYYYMDMDPIQRVDLTDKD